MGNAVETSKRIEKEGAVLHDRETEIQSHRRLAGRHTIKGWLRTIDTAPLIMIGLGASLAIYTIWHHLVKDNTVNVNPSNPRQWMEKDSTYEKVMPEAVVEHSNPINMIIDRDTGKSVDHWEDLEVPSTHAFITKPMGQKHNDETTPKGQQNNVEINPGQKKHHDE